MGIPPPPLGVCEGRLFGRLKVLAFNDIACQIMTLSERLGRRKFGAQTPRRDHFAFCRGVGESLGGNDLNYITRDETIHAALQHMHGCWEVAREHDGSYNTPTIMETLASLCASEEGEARR
jgi:hypothetical protein